MSWEVLTGTHAWSDSGCRQPSWYEILACCVCDHEYNVNPWKAEEEESKVSGQPRLNETPSQQTNQQPTRLMVDSHTQHWCDI